MSTNQNRPTHMFDQMLPCPDFSIHLDDGFDLHARAFGQGRHLSAGARGIGLLKEAAIDLVNGREGGQIGPAAAEALLKGYREGLEQPQPALLYEGETWLRSLRRAPRRQAGEVLERSRRISESQAAAEDCQPVDREPAEGSPKAFDSARAWRAAAASDGRAMSRSHSGAAAMSCARPRRWCRRPGPGPHGTAESEKFTFP